MKNLIVLITYIRAYIKRLRYSSDNLLNRNNNMPATITRIVNTK